MIKWNNIEIINNLGKSSSAGIVKNKVSWSGFRTKWRWGVVEDSECRQFFQDFEQEEKWIYL